MTRKILSALVAVLLIATLTACTPQIIINTNDKDNQSAASQTENATANGTQATQSQNDATSSVTETPKDELQQSANSQTTSAETAIGRITKEQAKEIAFNHAGVTAADVYDLKAELDRDDGIESYEIEFKAARVEYEYDIHAGTGEILKSEKD